MEARIEKLEKELAELKAGFEKKQQPEKWQDKLMMSHKHDECYLIQMSNAAFMVLKSTIEDVKPEHAFKKREQAELLKERMVLMLEMHAFAHVRNEGWVADWEDGNQIKHGVTYFVGKFNTNYHYSCNNFVFGISVETPEIAEEMFKIFGKRIAEFYNEQY